MKRLIAFAWFALMLCLPVRFTYAVVINFDDVAPVSGAPVVAYLAGHGITFIPGPGAGNPVIQGNQAPQVTSPSPPNVFGVGGILSDYSYVFDFATPISSFSFTPPALGNASTMAAWTATAFSASNVFISGINNQYFIHGPNAPQATWTLNGPNIDHIEFHSNVMGFAGSALIMDDLTFAAAAVPEPSTLLLLASGLAAMIGFTRRLKG